MVEPELLERKRLESDNTEDTRTKDSPGYRHTQRKGDRRVLLDEREPYRFCHHVGAPDPSFSARQKSHQETVKLCPALGSPQHRSSMCLIPGLTPSTNSLPAALCHPKGMK